MLNYPNPDYTLPLLSSKAMMSVIHEIFPRWHFRIRRHEQIHMQHVLKEQSHLVIALNTFLKYHRFPDVISVIDGKITLIKGRIVHRASHQTIVYIKPFALV